MGTIKAPLKVKLFVGILTSMPDLLPAVRQRLADLFGTVDIESNRYAFDFTHYYDEEMGTPIFRWFIGFEDLIPGEQIASIKHATNELETAFVTGFAKVRRPVNLDPGYLEESKIVLASTKNFYHRILLAQGIYGEVTMHFRGKRWEAFPWSFPDFRNGQYDGFFTELRQKYRQQLIGSRRQKNGLA